MWIPPQSTSTSTKPLEVNQYVGDKSFKKRAYVKIEEWEPHKEFVLRQRHAKVKEKDILHALRYERGFMVEMHQLKKVLQLWNSKRNLKRKQRDYIVQIVKERRRAGKNQTVFLHPSGTLIDLAEVKEIMRRYGNSEPLEPPSPGGLIPGSPRIRQTAPDILFDPRGISPIYSDPYSLSHSNDTTSPESLHSMQSPPIGTGIEDDHRAIDIFLEQTTAQPYANVSAPTTMGYSTNISPGALYPPIGFGEDLSLPTGYSNRPIRNLEIDSLLDHSLPRPTLPIVPPSSITSGYFPGSSSSDFFAAQPPPPMQYSPASESYSYSASAPPRRPSPQHYPQPPVPPPMQPAAPAPRPVYSAAQSKSSSSFFSFPNFGFSKKSKKSVKTAGGDMIQPGAPASAPYMQPGAFADPGPPQPPPPPIAAPGYMASGPIPPPSDARFSWSEEAQKQAPRVSASGRQSARRSSRKETYIKEEFPEISTLDYSRDDSRKGKETRMADDNAALLEMANRAGRLLVGIPPKDDESSKRARRRAEEEAMRRAQEEDAMRRAEEEEIMRRQAEDIKREHQRREEYRRYAQEQEIQGEWDRSPGLNRAYIRPDVMEVDEDAEWSEEEPEIDNWQQDSGKTWKQEPADDDEWGDEEETEDSWQDPVLSQQAIDSEEQRLQETFQRVSGKINFFGPIMRIQREVVIGPPRTIFARVEPKSGAKFKIDDYDDSFVIKLKEIKNEDDDLVSALDGFTLSDKDKKEKDDSKDLVSALEGLQVSDDKKEGGEKWDDEEAEEKWSDEGEEEEEKWDEGDEQEEKWEEEEESKDKWGDKNVDNVLATLDNLSLSENPAPVLEKPVVSTELPPAETAVTEKQPTHSKNYIPFKKFLVIELDEQEYKVEFASEEMENIYRIHLRDWLKNKVEDAEWELGMTYKKPKKSNGKKFLDDTTPKKFPKAIYKATKGLVKAATDPEATEAEIQYDSKLWNWVLQRHQKIVSYMKETSDTYWTTTWSKTEQAVVYFLPFLGRRFGAKHWFTLEAIKLLGETYMWEEIEGGWKDGLRLRNLAYDGFVGLGMGDAGIVSECVDDGVVERDERKGRRKMELRRAVEYYRMKRGEFGDWSQVGVYAIGKLIRALAKVDKERAKKLAPIAAAGLLKIPKGFWWRKEIANAIWMVGEAMREVGMVKEATAFLWETMPRMRAIENIVESLPGVRVLGGIADGFELLGKAVKAIEWRGRGLEVAAKALGKDHPETILWIKRVQKGLEARGVQFLIAPKLRTVEWIAGRVLWEGQRRKVGQKKLLKFTRGVVRKFESSSNR